MYINAHHDSVEFSSFLTETPAQKQEVLSRSTFCSLSVYQIS